MAKVQIHHITPARSDLNYGKAINDLIRHLPDEDWICLRDIDTLPVDHVSFIRQCEEIAKANEYGLVSCMTNRLGLKWQLWNGVLDDDPNIDNHFERGRAFAQMYGSEVIDAPREIGGVMMLFPLKVWKEVGGFREGKIVYGNQMLDNIFYEQVKKAGYRIGIAKGIYLFHIYRWNKNPRSKEGKKHLI